MAKTSRTAKCGTSGGLCTRLVLSRNTRSAMQASSAALRKTTVGCCAGTSLSVWRLLHAD